MMDLARASDIVVAINHLAFVSMDLDLNRETVPLADVSLAEMLEAKAVVEVENERAQETARRLRSSCSITMVPDDRLIAAAYCFLHFPTSREPVLAIPQGTTGRAKCVAIVAIDIARTEEDDDDD